MILSSIIEDIPLEEWRYAWRIEQLDSPITSLDRACIRPMSTTSSKRLSDYVDTIGLHDDFPFKKGLFRRTESSDHPDDLQKEEKKVKKWLYQRGIPFAAPVVLVYDSSSAVATTWKMLVRYWRLFYYPVSDDLTVCDGSMNWCLLFFHEHEIHFGTMKPETNKTPQRNATAASVSTTKSPVRHS